MIKYVSVVNYHDSSEGIVIITDLKLNRLCPMNNYYEIINYEIERMKSAITIKISRYFYNIVSNIARENHIYLFWELLISRVSCLHNIYI